MELRVHADGVNLSCVIVRKISTISCSKVKDVVLDLGLHCVYLSFEFTCACLFASMYLTT
jgi:hypothetical protein